MQTEPIVLVVAERERRDGKWLGYHAGELIVTSTQPFLDGARVLLARGLDPQARYVMRRSRDGIDALISSLGEAAKWTVSEGGHSPIFRAWRAWDGPVVELFPASGARADASNPSSGHQEPTPP